MRHLLVGVALAALLAAGLPAAAQTGGAAQPATPPAASPQTMPAVPGHEDMSPGARPSAASRTANTAGKPAIKAKTKHAAKSQNLAHRRATRSPDDNIAEDLNRQELARLQQDSTRTPGHSVSEMPAQPAPRGTAPNP